RTLVRSHPAGNSAWADRGGKFLVLNTHGGDSGLAVVARGTGEELGRLGIPGLSPFHLETSGALLTCNTGGILRWPGSEDSAGGVIRFGPRERRSSLSNRQGAAASPDGRVLAVPNSGAGAIILHRDHPGLPVATGPQDDVRNCAVSRDGRFVATG